jgi:hypothetical protein
MHLFWFVRTIILNTYILYHTQNHDTHIMTTQVEIITKYNNSRHSTTSSSEIFYFVFGWS